MHHTNLSRVHPLTTYSKQRPPININFHNKYTKNKNQRQVQHHHGYELYRAGSQMSLGKMNQVQLFTKLRENKYAGNKENDPNLANINYNSTQISCQQKNAKNKQEISIQQNLQNYQLNSYQEQLLQNLKLQKVSEILKQCMLSGYSVKQIVEQGELLVDLDQRILRILQTEEGISETVNYCIQDVKPNSVLESTAQYWQPHSRKLESVQPVPNPKQNGEGDILLDSQFQKKIVLSQVQHIESTIKNLQSPTSLFLNPLTFDSFNKNIKSPHASNPNENKINVMQFTLGQLESIQDEENFTEREESQKLIDDVIAFNENARGQQRKMGDAGKYKISQFEESSQQIIVKQQPTKEKLTPPTLQKVKQLCFNRNKLPKGKAIKNKVMGQSTSN